jgi:ATP/maltotriose-dependent transcriptional regulator MalT
MPEEPKKLADVFKTIGLPPYTYVKPKHFGEVRGDIEQPGKHLLIEGPSGIGKTCVVYKVFEELQWKKDEHYTYVSARDVNAEVIVDAFFLEASQGGDPQPSVVVIDDYHLLPAATRAGVGAVLKD